MPKHQKYREPFVGACHVISQKYKAQFEVVNDFDAILVNFILVATLDPEKLNEAVKRLPYSRFLFEKWKAEGMPLDPFEQAVRFFYMNRSAITKGNFEDVPQTGWRHSNSSGQNPANGYVSACEVILGFAERMKGVMIECMDFRNFIPKYDDHETVWYVDPPYIGREKYYTGNFDEQAHRELAELLNNIKGKVILSYYDDPLLNELYPNWNRETFSSYKQVGGGSGSDVDAEELLLMNFENQLTLF
jgi:DNA adenine methylase